MRSKFRHFVLHVGRGTAHIGRWAWYASAAVLAILALIFTVVRIGLPALAEKKAEIENFISEKSSYPVRIGKLNTYWEGLYPGLRIEGLEIFSSADLLRAVRFGEVRISLGLLPLLWGELQINSLVVVKPSLALERLADGRLRVTGFDPIQASGQTGKGKFLRWLLQQKEVIIENGELQWFDHMGERQGLYLSKINLSLRNASARHKLGITAQFPRDVCGDCSLILDISGNPLIANAWSGNIFLKAVGMRLERVPLAVRSQLPEQLRGKFDVQLWSKWQNGRLRSAEGDVSVADFRLPLKSLKTPIAIKEAGTNLELKKRGKHWDLNLENLRLGLRGPAWSAGHLRIAHGPDVNTIHVEHMNIGDVTDFLAGIDGGNKFLRNLRALRPRGEVHAVKLRIESDGTAPDHYSLEARVEGLETQPFRKIPGVRGVSGQLSMHGRRGNFLLDANGVTVSAPHVFRAPVNARSVFARLSWLLQETYVQLDGKDLRVVADDGQGTGRLRLRVPYNKRIKPYLQLHANFSDGNGAHASRYYPINLLTEKTVAWLDRSIVSGHVTSGDLVYEGNVANFPFRDGNGRFEARLHVRDGVFNYLPGWAPVTGVDADVQFQSSKMLITGNRGKIGDLDVRDTIVRADDLRKRGNAVVEVSATIEGSVAGTLQVLRESPASVGRRDWKTYLDVASDSTGQGTINLQLNIPVRHASAFTMTGEYVVRDGVLNLKLAKLKAESIHGRVEFDQSGPTNGRLRGRFLGGDAELDIAGQVGRQRDETLLSGHGTLTGPGLGEAFDWRFASYLQGHAAWHGTMRLRRGIPLLHVEAELRQMSSALPVPLNRPAGITEKLVLKSEHAGRKRHIIAVHVGKTINGKLAFAKQAGAWGLARGTIGLGVERVRLPEGQGLHVSVRTRHVDADSWLRVFRFGGANAKRPPDYLRRFTGDFDSVYLINREFGQLHIDLARDSESWVGWMKGDAADGQITISPAAKGSTAKIELNLQRLVVLNARPEVKGDTTDPRALPTLGLKVKSFQYEDKELGEIDFWAVHTTLGWKIVHLDLVRPEMKLFLNGDWLLIDGRQSTELELRFNSSDMGKTLQAFASPDQMEGGKVNLTSKLSWRGSPVNPALSTLDGNVQASAEDGRFLQVKDRGRLFGLLDFSSIGKFLTLDFGPLFGKGLPFKTLSGDISIENGNAYTRNLYMTGSAAQMSVNGRVGLVAKDFDFALQVVPRLGTNIGVWGILGPQAGVILLALEKLLEKQIARGTRITYVVKGPWDDPTIERLGEKPEAEEAEVGRN